MLDNHATPKLTVGIILYNSRDDIDACLQTLEAQTFQDFEVVLLDNASPDDSADWLRENWSQYSLIVSEKNLGFGNGHNLLISDTKSKYYMPLNPDVELTEDYILNMVSTMEAEGNQDVGQVAGKLFFPTHNNKSATLYTAGHGIFRDGFAINLGYSQNDSPQYQQEREVFGANGAAALYRRAMLEDIQYTAGEYFDRDIFLYHEDVDLDFRARLLGWRCIFQPNAIGYHSQGKSGGTSVRSIIYSISATRYYTSFKYAFSLDLFTYHIPTFLLHILFMVLTEPKRGFATFRYILERLGQIQRKRRWLAKRRKLSRQQLHEWYRWSEDNAHQSYSYLARFWRGRIAKSEI